MCAKRVPRHFRQAAEGEELLARMRDAVDNIAREMVQEQIERFSGASVPRLGCHAFGEPSRGIATFGSHAESMRGPFAFPGLMLYMLWRWEPSTDDPLHSPPKHGTQSARQFGGQDFIPTQ